MLFYVGLLIQYIMTLKILETTKNNKICLRLDVALLHNRKYI